MPVTDNSVVQRMARVRIAICDDEQTHLDVLERHIEGCFLWKDAQLDVKPYISANALLSDMESGCEFEFIFLDINMPDIDGIELCDRILNIKESSIIFVSTHMERQPSVDGFYPAMLLPKPYTQEAFDNVIKAFLARKDAMRHFSFTNAQDGKKYSMPCRDIYFFSMADHRLMITTPSGTYQDASRNLHDVERELVSEGFFRCHKSHLINLRYYENNDYDSVYLKCGGKRVEIRLARGKGDAVKAAYLKNSWRL